VNIDDIVHSADGLFKDGKVIGADYLNKTYSVLWDDTNPNDHDNMHGWNDETLVCANFDNLINELENV